MRKPVAMEFGERWTQDGKASVPVVLCDDGAMFRRLPYPDSAGRHWIQLEPVPGTPADPATDGYLSFEEKVLALLERIAER